MWTQFPLSMKNDKRDCIKSAQAKEVDMRQSLVEDADNLHCKVPDPGFAVVVSSTRQFSYPVTPEAAFQELMHQMKGNNEVKPESINPRGAFLSCWPHLPNRLPD